MVATLQDDHCYAGGPCASCISDFCVQHDWADREMAVAERAWTDLPKMDDDLEE